MQATRQLYSNIINVQYFVFNHVSNSWKSLQAAIQWRNDSISITDALLQVYLCCAAYKHAQCSLPANIMPVLLFLNSNFK